MKAKTHFLTFALLTLGFAKVYAEQPMLSKPQPVIVESIEVKDEAASVLTFITDNIELTENRFFNSDSSYKRGGCFNGTNQFKNPFDSTDFSQEHFYLKQVFPVIMKMDKQNIEMIEIL